MFLSYFPLVSLLANTVSSIVPSRFCVEGIVK
nr:MAG TPA: hypothetical protein [Caudoviricetes sp.]